MKNLNLSLAFCFLVLAGLLTSCSTNQFVKRKNHQPRVQVEALTPQPQVETASIETNATAVNDTLPLKSKKPATTQLKSSTPKKQTIAEKMVQAFIPKKKTLFEPVFHPQKRSLNKVKHTQMDGDQITGLVISLVALALAITALLMIIGMVHGNVWVYFVVGLILAIAAIIMAFIAKHLLPFRGISLGAGVLAILAVVLLIIFLILVTVFSIVF
jgi:hypothetical protein